MLGNNFVSVKELETLFPNINDGIKYEILLLLLCP